MNTVCLSFWSTLGSLGIVFGSLLDSFSGMAAKVKTVLAPARELDFQGLGGSGSILFQSLVRTSFSETSFERIWANLGRFGKPFWHPFRRKTRSVLRTSRKSLKEDRESVETSRKSSQVEVKVYLTGKPYD